MKEMKKITKLTALTALALLLGACSAEHRQVTGRSRTLPEPVLALTLQPADTVALADTACVASDSASTTSTTTTTTRHE